MNSRGRQPTVKRRNIFDPYGVAPLFNIAPWVFTHGYSCLAALRPGVRASVAHSNGAPASGTARCRFRMNFAPCPEAGAPMIYA